MYISNIGGVFMTEQQQGLVLSPYMEIYELVNCKQLLIEVGNRNPILGNCETSSQS